jgi:cation transport regulator ChaC
MGRSHGDITEIHEEKPESSEPRRKRDFAVGSNVASSTANRASNEGTCGTTADGYAKAFLGALERNSSCDSKNFTIEMLDTSQTSSKDLPAFEDNGSENKEGLSKSITDKSMVKEIVLEKGQVAMFGYGSLIFKESMEDSLTHLNKLIEYECVPCNLVGWRRSWDAIMPNIRGYYEELSDGTRSDPKYIAYLNIYKTSSSSDRVNGLLYTMSSEYAKEFDKREWIYDRVPISSIDLEGVTLTLNGGEALVYVAKSDFCLNQCYPTDRSQVAICASYKETVDNGLEQQEEEFREQYNVSTDAVPECLVIRDKRDPSKPRRPTDEEINWQIHRHKDAAYVKPEDLKKLANRLSLEVPNKLRPEPEDLKKLANRLSLEVSNKLGPKPEDLKVLKVLKVLKILKNRDSLEVPSNLSDAIDVIDILKQLHDLEPEDLKVLKNLTNRDSLEMPSNLSDAIDIRKRLHDLKSEDLKKLANRLSLEVSSSLSDVIDIRKRLHDLKPKELKVLKHLVTSNRSK